MNRDLYSENLQLYLDTFCQRMYQLKKAKNPPLITKIVLAWTKSQPLLTKKLLHYILHSDNKIRAGKEAIAVEQAIRNYLVKEFKQDNLTLAIRKILYQRDLESILEKNNNKINAGIQLHLTNCQKKLGLTNKQCKSIQDNYLTSNRNLLLDSNATPRRPAKQIVHNIYPTEAQQHQQLPATTRSSLAPTNQNSQISYQPSTTNSPQLHPGKTSEKKWLWLLILIPIALLTIKNTARFTNSNALTNSQPSLGQQKLCVDLASRQSPRMSIGDKFLTKNYSHLNQASVIHFYQGVNAFARCEFTAAQQKFEQALTLDKNNPEALIYRNNTKAIAQEHFKIAVSIPLGTKTDIAWEILRGVAQAQTQINERGGIRNKLLLVQVVNDDNNPQIVKQVASQLVADKNILAVVGHNSSNSSLAAAGIYQRHQLLMVSPTSISTELSGIGSYILRTTPNVAALAAKLADYARSQSLNNITICHDSQDSASRSYARQFQLKIKKNGGTINQIYCDFASPDHQAKSVVEQAIAFQADAILLASSVQRMSKAIALAKANQQRLPLLGNDSLYTYQTIAQGQEAIARMVITSSWLPNAPANLGFSQTAREYWGGTVNWRTAMAHDATKAIIQGLQNSDTREELQSTLTQPDFMVNGATGKFYFQNGDRSGSIQLAYVKKSGDRYHLSQLDN